VPSSTPLSSPTIAPPIIWRPPLQASWQWQLSNLPVDQSVDALMYDIDLFDNDASVVASLHAQGRKVICYLSAGTWERWRPDAHLFPPSVRGTAMDDWPDEQWLDIRQLDVLKPIMEARLDLCQRKGFDGVEPDNIDGWVNETGFPLTAEDQLAYNRWLAAAAHARGMSIGLKNDLRQVEDLVDTFDWALNEECFQLNECTKLTPFIEAGKAVFHVEYALAPRDFCAEAVALGFNSMRKDIELSAYREACPATAAPD